MFPNPVVLGLFFFVTEPFDALPSALCDVYICHCADRPGFDGLGPQTDRS